MAALMFGPLGSTTFLIACSFFYFAGLMLAGRRFQITGGGVIGYVTLVLSLCVALQLLVPHSLRPFSHMAGGAVGHWVGEIMRAMFATTGTLIISISALLASILSLSGMSLRQIARLPKRGIVLLKDLIDGRDVKVDVAQEEDGNTTAPGIKKSSLPPQQRPDWMSPPVQEQAPEIEVADDKASDTIVTAPPDVDTPPVDDAEADSGPHTGKIRTRQRKSKGTTTDESVSRVPGEDLSHDLDAEIKIEEPADAAEPAIAEPVIDAPPPARPPPCVADQKKLPFNGPTPMPFEFPSLSLLEYETPTRHALDREALNARARKLEQKLEDFGVKGKVIKIQPGPVVTMFEYEPAPGVKISKIANLADDLTMALEALRIRIVAPIPGKGVVGVEVPSAVRETVYLKEILASSEFQDSRAKLPICLGKDIVGNPVVADLAKAPHILVAGATGSGKSVGVNAFILSLVYRCRPEDLRLILVDPKMLELSIYDDIPHLLLPVVTQAKKASLALKWAVSEMERRYKLLSAVNVRNISGFNAKIEKIKNSGKVPEGVAEDELEHLPFIVIILDELADLMMVSGKEVEASIARLAQMARAAGIHLVVATQRPSVDVVTGLIKANFPTRMSFQVAQKVDSRTILDRMGAENLLGMGDMLFLPPGTSALQRVQGCFVGDEEVERVTEHLKQFGPPEYDLNILIDEDEQGKDLSGEDYDVLFDQAVAIVTETRNPSISYLQRRLKIGYNRSARIIERMEFDGIISSPDHRGTRKVLAPSAPPHDA